MGLAVTKEFGPPTVITVGGEYSSYLNRGDFSSLSDYSLSEFSISFEMKVFAGE